ncbi:hypothetical protein CDAR_103301 [Caerostris darwini]|uniref:Uncharacterized protein n=1 Tax=Caerostris darwini TaxID=1538125 RepID=A0AAV4V394_9ARAC|nr:hypothetical protein CDAR_103301 [Caerostris darwini]
MWTESRKKGKKKRKEKTERKTRRYSTPLFTHLKSHLSKCIPTRTMLTPHARTTISDPLRTRSRVPKWDAGSPVKRRIVGVIPIRSTIMHSSGSPYAESQRDLFRSYTG